MNNEHCEGLIDYLNGTLTMEQTRQFEEHLKTCEECREIVDATGQLPYLSDPVEPPVGMKSRILANVFAEDEGIDDQPANNSIDGTSSDGKSAVPESHATHSSASSASTVTAGSAAGGIASGSSRASSSASVNKPLDDQEPKRVPMAGRGQKRNWMTPLIAAVLLASLLGNAYAFMQLQGEQPLPTEPQTAFQSIDLEPSENFSGDATAAVIEEEDGALNLVVQAEQLAALEGDQVYQVWLIKGDQPIPAGAFTANANGEGSTYFNIANNTEEWDTIAITLEPEAGNELPEGEVVLSAGL